MAVWDAGGEVWGLGGAVEVFAGRRGEGDRDEGVVVCETADEAMVTYSCGEEVA